MEDGPDTIGSNFLQANLPTQIKSGICETLNIGTDIKWEHL